MVEQFMTIAMTLPGSSAPADSARLARLRAAKRLAGGALLGAIALFALAESLQRYWAGFAYVGAFAEAAVVGALADWFAVVALFRHPLGLPLPHTAILRRNRDRIADNLGTFIQDQFLATERVISAVAQFDPAARAAAWLAQRDNATRAGGYAARALAFVLRALDEERVQAFLTHYISAQLRDLDLVRPAGRLLDILSENRRYQVLLDAALARVHETLSHEDVRHKLVESIAAQIPGKAFLEPLGLDKRAGNYVLDRLLAALAELIAAVEADADHPLRRQFDAMVASFSARLKNDADFAARIRAFQHELAQHPDVRAYFGELWADLRAWLAADLEGGQSQVRGRMVDAVRSLGELLQGDDGMRAWINTQLLEAAPALVEEYRPAIGTFIARQVKSWNDDYLLEQIELNIGRDLQYIRLNGTLVGGAAGLLLYAITRAVAAL
jgi:uncharacterized membrane-anchored protein YjiN (DUF445 family)